jgi:IS605 OrfB family transposase
MRKIQRVLKPDLGYKAEDYGLKPRNERDKCYSPWLVPNAESLFESVSGHTSGFTEAGRSYFADNVPRFGQLLRQTLSSMCRDGVEIGTEKFDKLKTDSGLASRVYNSVGVWAKGQHGSMTECALRAVDLYTFKLNKLGDKCAQVLEEGGDISKYESQFDKYVRRIAKHSAEVDNPRYFPGQTVYDRQHLYKEKEAFKRDYTRARNNIFIVYGTLGEAHGNSHLIVKFLRMQEQNTRRYVFGVFRAKELLHTFSLDHKDGLLLHTQLVFQDFIFGREAYTDKKGNLRERKTFGLHAERSPITVTYNRIELSNRFAITVTWSKDVKLVEPKGLQFLGIDMNATSLDWAHIDLSKGVKDKGVVESGKYGFLQDETSQNRARKLHIFLNTVVDYCKTHSICLVLEDLDWEGAKQAKSVISSVLHTIPYKKLRDMLIRKCLLAGVAIRFVNPAMTSQLGCMLDYGLSRDISAAVLIGLKSSIEGLRWLEDKAEKLLSSKIFTLRVIRKSSFSKKIQVVNKAERLVAGMDGHPCIDTYGFLPKTGCLTTIVRSLNGQLGNIYWSRVKKIRLCKPDLIPKICSELPIFWFIAPCLPQGKEGPSSTGLKLKIAQF